MVVYDAITPTQWVLFPWAVLIAFTILWWLFWWSGRPRNMSTPVREPPAHVTDPDQSVDRPKSTGLGPQTIVAPLGEPPRASLGEQAVDPGWQDFQRWRAQRYVER
jgi:hypothetical protein